MRRITLRQALALAPEFWTHVERPDRDPDTCWEWTRGRRTGGYGTVRGELAALSTVASRVAWVLSRRRLIPPKLQVLHRCDNPPCCRPSHLFLGTQSDNVRDCLAKGRAGRRVRRCERCGSRSAVQVRVQPLNVGSGPKSQIMASVTRSFCLGCGRDVMAEVRATLTHETV